MSLYPLDFYLSRVVTHGELRVIAPDGTSSTFGQAGAKPRVAVRLHDKAFAWKLALRPGLALGEGYMNGILTIEEGTLRDFLEIALVSQDRAGKARHVPHWLGKLWTLYHLKDMWNGRRKSADNVHHHYDIDHALYETFLDKDMQYSCAYWEDGVITLEEAQLAKKRHIARKLLLQPGMEVLDIGSGWGGLALQLARDYGVNVTGLTLSTDQYATATRRAEEAGLSDRVTFKLQDYREETKHYDRIVSVGMFEHVGLPNFREYFAEIYRLLADDGVALIHTIAKRRGPGPTNEWITRYIFPGGYLPTLSELAPVIEDELLWVSDLEVLRLHYAETLKAWNERFQAHRAEIAARFDERFCRMWEFYLQACEGTFRYQDCCVFQLQLAKRVDAVPITRDYLYRPEKREPPASLVDRGHQEAAE